MSNVCRLFHEWSKWKEWEVTVTYSSGKKLSGTRQRRVCHRCGKMQIRNPGV